MRVLAFDGRTGAAGDVICGALVASGADPAVLSVVEESLPVEYEFHEASERGIAATRAHVRHADGTDDAVAHDGEGGRRHDHTHDHPDDTDDGETGGASHDGADPNDADEANDTSHADDAETDHAHSHGHSHHTHDASDGKSPHTHDHAHGENGEGDAEGAGPARSYETVREIVASMGLPAGVERDALATIETLGEAEAAVHGTDLSETVFHEVGTDDAIADVVGAALLIDDLDPDRIVTTPVAVGGGEVTFSHGTYPVPTPAVTRIAERTGLATVGGPVDRELLTPTGAAILGTLAESVDRLPPVRATATGYGAGAYELGDRPNVLRATVGERVTDRPADDESPNYDKSIDGDGSADGDGSPNHDEPEHATHDGGKSETETTSHSHGHASGDANGERGLSYDEIAVLETNLDDATPEVLGSLQETLLAAGANDVTILPATMKKARPGHLVTVICDPSDAQRLAERLARETGTLGVRETGARHRWIADRRIESATIAVDGREFAVDVKVATDGEAVYDVSGEYDDALAVARETSVAVRDVLRRAERVVRDRVE